MIRKAIQVPVVGLGALAVSLFAAADAQAVSVWLGSRHPQISDSFDYRTNSGVEFTATATETTRQGHVRKSHVVRNRWGLGVRSRFRDSNQIDGLGLSERLNLTFNHAVKLVSATFSAVGHGDGATVTLDGAHLFSGVLPRRHGNFATLSFSDSAIGSVASFAPRGKYDDFYLKSVHVEKVPEPMTVLGTGLALGVGAALERRRKKSKQVKAS